MARPVTAWGSLPFAEQIAFFNGKVDMPTQSWLDLLGAGHDRAFVVAGAMKADLLADLHAAVLKAIEQGTTLDTFRKDFNSIVAKRGWTGWTGEDTPEGRAWRQEIIYGTNLRTSYQAGRYAQAQAIAHRRPYWRYVHNDTVKDPRELHKNHPPAGWNGLILRADNEFWARHWPPNGWNCRCRVETLAQRDIDRMGKSGPDPTPDDGTYEWLDKRTGKTHTLPQGVDPGWDYTPGATRDLIAEVKAKAAGLPGALGEDLAKDIAKQIARQDAQAKAYRTLRRIDPERDDLLTAIAKAGGLNKFDAELEGIDPAEFKRRGHSIFRIFTSNGESFDGMAEHLKQYGYPVLDEHGNYSPNALLDHVMDSLGGRKAYSTQNSKMMDDLLAQWESRQAEDGIDDALANLVQEITPPPDVAATINKGTSWLGEEQLQNLIILIDRAYGDLNPVDFAWHFSDVVDQEIARLLRFYDESL